MAGFIETHSGSASVARDGSVTLVRTFRLFTGNAAARPAWSIALIGINKYDVHPDDTSCRATDVQAVPVPGELGWFDVTYTYSNKPFDVGVAENASGAADPGSTDPTVQSNPTLRTPVIKYGKNVRTVPFTRDWTQPTRKAVANSAGQKFEGETVEDFTAVISVSFNLDDATSIRAKQADYMNRVNDASFSIVAADGAYPAGTLRCNSWEGSLQYEPEHGWYRACEVELEYKQDGWDRQYLDAGTYEIYNTGTILSPVFKEKAFPDLTGNGIVSPVKLNGTGGKLATGASDVYLTFRPYKWVSFVNIFA